MRNVLKVTETLLKGIEEIGYEVKDVIADRNATGWDCIELGGETPAARLQIWVNGAGRGDIYVGKDNRFYEAFRNISKAYNRDTKQHKRHFTSISGCIEFLTAAYRKTVEAEKARRAADTKKADKAAADKAAAV